MPGKSIPFTIILILALNVTSISADDLLYRYEGNVLPYDMSAGWIIADPCEEPCNESIENGHFVLHWPQPAQFANYHLLIAGIDEPPPPSLWVEWQFSSNHPIGPNFFTCDASFWVHYGSMSEVVFMYGDTAISFSGGDFITGLAVEELHTYRYESLDGINYTIAVDGQKFINGFDSTPNDGHFVQLRGGGSCENFLNTINEWDFVRYGTISDGESIVSSDPPSGILDALQYPALDRFTVTFDQPGYVYIDDVTVKTTGGVIPKVIQTRRLDNGEPDTLQIVLDQPISTDDLTTFTLNTGGLPNTVLYSYVLFTGACCLTDDSCVETNIEECLNVGGNFHVDELCSPLQACCLPDRSCHMLDPLCCQDRGGSVQGENSECTAPDCVDGPEIIPTVSEWGMAILTLLILIAATTKLSFGYRLKNN